MYEFFRELGWPIGVSALIGFCLATLFLTCGCQEPAWADELECRDGRCQTLCQDYGLGEVGWCEVIAYEEDHEHIAPWETSACFCR